VARDPGRTPVSPESTRAPVWAAAIVLFAGFLWSLQGLTIRLLEQATSEQIVYWRNLGQYTALMVFVAITHRGRLMRAFNAAGPWAVAGGLCQCMSSMSVVFAFSLTTVANVNFILSTGPFAAGLLAYLLLGERLSRVTITAMALGAVGVGVMMLEGLSGGHLAGNALVVLTVLGFAGMTVALRMNRGADMTPTVCWGSGLGVLAGLLLTQGAIALPAQDIALCFAMGAIQIGLGQVLFILGSRHVAAGPLAFLTLSEIVLGPVWAWLGVNEVPNTLTLVGGAIVIAAIVWQTLGERKR
jgi:drug/metabolite transporter (DMT)-like permease